MSEDPMYDEDRDPDEPPRLAYWVPDEAVRNLTMERALHSNETHTQLAKRLLEEALPLATMAVTHMALNSRKEEVRLAAAKYVMEHSLGAPGKATDVPTGKHVWDSIHEAVLVERPGGSKRGE